ncbi:hypothetical protein JCM8547_005606 [Rhodosporidiobolus lusitaniae]
MSEQIVCGVNCACASVQQEQQDPASSTYSAPAVPLNLSAKKAGACTARDSCKYNKEGGCACGASGGMCSAAQAKKGCERGLKGECSCTAGTCAAAESARASCSKKGDCGCAPGQCVAAGFTA